MRFQSIFKTLTLLLLPWVIVFAVPEWRGVLLAQTDDVGTVGSRFTLPLRLPQISAPAAYSFLWDRKEELVPFDPAQKASAAAARHPYEIPDHAPLWYRARKLSEMLQQIPTQTAKVANVPERPTPLLPEVFYLSRFPSEDGRKSTRVNATWRQWFTVGVAQGERTEPQNAYWPILRMALHLAAGEKPAAIRTLRQAARCSYYDAHTWDQLHMRVLEDVPLLGDERHLILEEKANLRNVEPRDHVLTSLRWKIGHLTVDAQDAGKPQQTWAISGDITRVIELAIEGKTMSGEKEAAARVAVLSWQWLGGWYHQHKFTEHLKASGASTSESSINNASGQIYVQYARKYGSAADLKRAISQVATVNRINQKVINSGNIQYFPWPEYVGYGSPLQWSLLRWWWPMEIFIGLAELSLAGIIIISLWIIPWNPELKPAGKSVTYGVASVILVTVVLSLLAFHFGHRDIESEREGMIARCAAWAIPLTILIFAWVGNGLWRCRETLVPAPKRQFESAAQLRFWRLTSFLVRSAPIHGAISLGLIAFGFDLWFQEQARNSVNEYLYGELRSFHDGLFALALIVGMTACCYVFVLLITWRSSFWSIAQAEFIRVAWALRMTLLWVFGISSWIYLGFHIAMMPLRASVAAELARVVANGY